MCGDGRVGVEGWWLEPTDVEGWEALTELLNRYWDEILPGERPIPPSEVRDEARFAPRHRTFLSVVSPNVAAATMVMDEIRPETARLKFLYVAPEHRRQGIGAQILQMLAGRASEAGRPKMSSTVPLDRPAASALLGRAGGRAGLVVELNRCSTASLDVAMLQGWVDRANDRAGGYSLVAFDGVCPDEHLEAFTAVIPVMNTAPGEDARRPSAALVRDNMQGHIDQGNESWTICARHDATGRFVGYTELSVSRHRPWSARQGDTGVDPEHRNRGLGRWLKARNALRLLREQPDVEYIETWNAASNASMLSINRPMGFRPVASWRQWELPTR